MANARSGDAPAPAGAAASGLHLRENNDAHCCASAPATQAPLIRVLPDACAWRGFTHGDHRALALHGSRARRRQLARQQRRGRR
jgi:hypothetical protein